MTRSNSTRSSNDRSGGAMDEEDIETAKSEFRLVMKCILYRGFIYSQMRKGKYIFGQVSAMRTAQLQCLLPHAHDLTFSSTLQTLWQLARSCRSFMANGTDRPCPAPCLSVSLLCSLWISVAFVQLQPYLTFVSVSAPLHPQLTCFSFWPQ